MIDNKIENKNRIIYYNNFAGHLLNVYNPNMLHPDLPYQWTDQNWEDLIDSIVSFGFNVFEFWLEPRLFSREGLNSEWGDKFSRQLSHIIAYAHSKKIHVEMLVALATSGNDWHTLCPNLTWDWLEIKHLWNTWIRRFPKLDIIGIFPGDPGACSLNGCSAMTYIDKSIEISKSIKDNIPEVEIEFGTWGPPFFGWGNIQGPQGWNGEFIPEYQHTAWKFDQRRSEESMNHLIKRLGDFPQPTSIAINLGFNPDGNPGGEDDSCKWIDEIQKTHHVQTWDFSLTEGENNIIPHYRFNRLFERRLQEIHLPQQLIRGGICFTMTPLLNQLSIYMSAQSFLYPNSKPDELASDFYSMIYGEEGRKIIDYLPAFEVIEDWGNYHPSRLSRNELNKKMDELIDLLHNLPEQGISTGGGIRIFPTCEKHLHELLFFAELFKNLSSPNPSYDELLKEYWQHVYSIYVFLPKHVDPRPIFATNRLIDYFKNLSG